MLPPCPDIQKGRYCTGELGTRFWEASDFRPLSQRHVGTKVVLESRALRLASDFVPVKSLTERLGGGGIGKVRHQMTRFLKQPEFP